MRKCNLAVLLVWCLSIAVLFPSAFAAKKENNPKMARVEAIKGNSRYYHGLGYGPTLDEARRAALENLCGKFSRSVANVARTNDTQDSEYMEEKGFISTFATLSNTEELIISEEADNYAVLIYVEKQQVESDMAMRDEKVRALLRQGMEMEQRVEIASALKYFYWAYTLSKTSTRPIMVEINGMNHDAKSWLHSHICTVFNSLSVKLDNVEERPGDLDPYLVNLSITFLDEPVADLDFSYMNNGNRIPDQHVKNGRASLAFEKLPADEIGLTVCYRYEDGLKSYDEQLFCLMDMGPKDVFSQSELSVPCKGSTPGKFEVKAPKLTKDEKKQAAQDALMAPASVGQKLTRVDTPTASGSRADAVIGVMEQLKKALDTRQYAGASKLFTPDGFALFTRMVESGQVRTAKSAPEWSVEMAGDYMVCKSIPVTVKYKGGHTVAEEIVCRFDADNKIESVAYALTRRAEDDIFRQNAWDMSARYAILRFMEDYQTAFALKRIDYIKSIFSDDAVIITGKRKSNAKTTTGDGGYFMTNEFTYNLQTKDQYIKNLSTDFSNKEFIKLTFEDNEIREQGGGLFNNVYWIEIRQFYDSSNYNDIGYLTLMIDMRSKDPTIKVRTWAPNKISLDELMSRYTFQ